MFTGIIESIGIVTDRLDRDSFVQYAISADFISELYPGQSISHNGICLTVAEIAEDYYSVQVITETLQIAQANWVIGERINLERALSVNYRFDGHIVQGHVDSIATVTHILYNASEIRISIAYPEQFDKLLIPKGSVCLNGISLTIAGLRECIFEVAIIPHTWKHTNLQYLSTGDKVNVEFDVLGKYISRYMQQTKIN